MNLLILRVYNNNIKKNIKLFPKTYKILKDIPNITTISFSILDPQKEIQPHKGPYRGIMRYFLCLDIPEGECYLLVNRNKYNFKNGDDILWDDTYTHFVVNNTNGKRIILLCDIYRNKLPLLTKVSNKAIFKLSKKFIKSYTNKTEVKQTIETNISDST